VDLSLTDTEQRFARDVRAWLEANVVPAPEGDDLAESVAWGRAWQAQLAEAGWVGINWPAEYGGRGASPVEVAIFNAEYARSGAPQLVNRVGINLAGPTLLAHGTPEQCRRWLPAIVSAEDIWCQLFSEPGAGSDLSGLVTRADPVAEGWRVTGQKVWTSYAQFARYGLCLARTEPDTTGPRGLSLLVVDIEAPGVDIRPLVQITGEAEFNEVFLDCARVPDAHRLGEVGDGWRVSASTLSSERQMVSGAGSGGIGRLGGSGADRLIAAAREHGVWDDPRIRDRVAALWAEEQIRGWTNARVRAELAAGQSPGAAASIGKVHQASLNQRIQDALVDIVGASALAWDDGEPMPREVSGLLRSLANSIEGGTTEVNKNVLGERVLGLPREPDPWKGRPWREVPRS